MDYFNMSATTLLNEPYLSVALAYVAVVALVAVVLATHLYGYKSFLALLPGPLSDYLRFAYSCFIKPHSANAGRDQKAALESFYSSQASVYDRTRARLLQGRDDMLALVAAQVQHRIKDGRVTYKPVWVDIGGGTGFNIEQMQQFVDVPTFFDRVFLVDLSPSLTAVAMARFKRLGWKNVEVICQDARQFKLEDYYKPTHAPSPPLRAYSDPAAPGARPDVVTLSYSLSMLPDYFPVLDNLSSSLAPHGVIGVADFYVQSQVEYQARHYLGGEINRHCMWISRVFWRTWFEADRVNLEAARRDYLEYRFGTILSVNARCHLLGLRIPYYVWIGCPRNTNRALELPLLTGPSPFLSALDLQSHSNLDTAIADEQNVINLSGALPLPSTFYQAHRWRIHYEPSLPRHRQFDDEYIYAFTWEDAKEDIRIFGGIKPDDEILAISSAGDNVLAYAAEGPRRIHAVDLNPNQNHLLELKLAAYLSLSHSDFFTLFGEGRHPKFRELLLSKLSPHLSSQAFQYWLLNGETTFSAPGLYHTGGSRHAIKLVQLISRTFGLQGEIDKLCSAADLKQQQDIWKRSWLRACVLNPVLAKLIFCNGKWLWKALGVPTAQRDLIEKDFETTLATKPALRKGTCAIHTYGADTIEPVVRDSLLSNDNFYYALALQGRYTPDCHPEYLSKRAFKALGTDENAEHIVRIHTDTVNDVLGRLPKGSLSIAVVMDSLDWFEQSDMATSGGAGGRADAQEYVRLLRRALQDGGRVLLRSAGQRPWYMAVFEEAGFECRCVAARSGKGECIDRVNMYASTWICTKKSSPPGSPGSLGSPVSGRLAMKRRKSSWRQSPNLEPLSIGRPAIDNE